METSQRLILLSLNLTIFLKSSEGPKTKVTSNFKRKEKKKKKYFYVCEKLGHNASEC